MTMSKELVEGLLKGSPVIDQWNKDIHTVLHAIFWLLKPEEIRGMMASKPLGLLSFCNEPYWWTIKESGRNAFSISLQARLGNILVEVYATKSHILAPPEFGRTQRVIENLPVLTEGLGKLFDLEDRCKPFLDAAATVLKAA